MKDITWLYSARNVGVKSAVKSVKWYWDTASSIISSSSILNNYQVTDYIQSFFIYMHFSALLFVYFYFYYASHVAMIIICFLRFSFFASYNSQYLLQPLCFLLFLHKNYPFLFCDEKREKNHRKQLIFWHEIYIYSKNG